MFHRNIIDEMDQWVRKKDRKPLILRGARQVGKTTAVQMFAKRFDRYIALNLEKREDAELFERGLPLDELIQAIFLHKGIDSSEGKTLLFIDEIQNSPKAVAMMRFFYESAKWLYVIAAGSLLESLMSRDKVSFPVGRVEYRFMYPLTFQEYLTATDNRQSLNLFETIPLPEYAHLKLREQFHKYTLIGGMPEVVKTYCLSQNIVDLVPIYQGLLTSFLDDVSKYARNQTMEVVIRHAIESAPIETGKRIKFQGFGNSNYRSREMSEALKTLERAMLIYLIYPTTAYQLPLRRDMKKSPRLQFLDTGLINYFVGLQEQYFKYQDLQAFYQGLLAEHIVGQELMTVDPRVPGRLNFWVRERKQSNAEIDFLIQHKGRLIPIEVKSGKAGALRSLHQFIDAGGSKLAVRLYAGSLETHHLKTPASTPYLLLDLPYFLARKIPEYIDWATTRLSSVEQ